MSMYREHAKYVQQVRKHLQDAERASNAEHDDVPVRFYLTGNAYYKHSERMVYLEFKVVFTQAKAGEPQQVDSQWAGLDEGSKHRPGDPLTYVYDTMELID